MTDVPGYYKKVLPVITLVIFGTITLALWKDQVDHERESILRHTNASAEQIRVRVAGLMNARFSALELLAERWVERDPPDFSRKRFTQFAQHFYSLFPGFSGINWADPQGVVRWVYPEQNRTGSDGRILGQHPDPAYAAAFEKAKETLTYQVTPSVALLGGRTGFDTFWPLVYKGELQGYLNGFFEIDHIMDICLAQDIFEDFFITVEETGRTIYRHGGPAEGPDFSSGLHVFRTIDFRNKVWKLRLKPGPGVYSPSAIPHMPFLLFGIALSVASSVLLYMLLKHMETLKGARDRALHEVSERKRAEKALQRNEKKLESLLKELAAKNAELESFVYTVSHDLKTPIVTIEGFVGALRQDFAEALKQEGEKYLEYIGQAARKMEALINDLLELSRIGRLVEKKSRLPFRQLVEESIEALRPQIDAKAIKMKVGKDLPDVYVDRKRLGQLVDNLLSNAIKYMGKDNPGPYIEVGAENQNGEEVFFVRDNGIGIEERYLNKIFGVFQRLPEAKQIEEGTGIGLTIVKRIVESHGGRIWVTSQPLKGTTFFFTLANEEVSS